jgi:hypothetical protein
VPLKIPARLVVFLQWLKIPSNLLSVLAIIAVVIVPVIEKTLKADEELRAKIDTLVETTNKIVAINERRPGLSGPGGRESYGLLTAQRENEIARATAIAESIKHDAYPAVLFALSNELMASGKFTEAHNFLEEVIRRGKHYFPFHNSGGPSTKELSEAHFLNARCFTLESTGRGKDTANARTHAESEMNKALDIYKTDDTVFGKGQLAVTYVEWAEIEEMVGEVEHARGHRQKAHEIVSAMPQPIDPVLEALVGVQKPPPEVPKISSDNLPHPAFQENYIVNFPSDPGTTAVFSLMPPDKTGQYSDGGTMYVYRSNVFAESYDMTQSRDKKLQIYQISWEKDLPRTGEGKHRVDLVWSIETFTKQEISGVQSQIGQPPKRFVAQLQNRTTSGVNISKQ